ncbi:MAG: hypothetical protein WC881_04105 [Elusimicrobiota bacterium]|jgi:hypothetical protein
MTRLVCLTGLAAALLTAPDRLLAQTSDPGALGIGFMAGSPIGFSAKYNLNAKTSIDIGLGAEDSDLHFHSDLLLNLPEVLPQPRKGKLPLYLGLGFKVQDSARTVFGFRFVGGIAYHMAQQPLEFFAEIAPIMETSPDMGSDVEGGVGVRYYFALPSGSRRSAR